MKIGKSESIEAIHAGRWKRMAEDIQVGWPMLRERIAALCTKMTPLIHDAMSRAAAADPATADRAAVMIGKRAGRLLQELS